MHNKAVKTIRDYLEIIDFITERYSTPGLRGDLIFRGLSSFDYRLLPGIYRTVDNGVGSRPLYGAPEHEILHHFIKNAMSLIDHIDRDDLLTWLTYAQHFGAPTRLLDFSSNPLISLYFCCKREPGLDGGVCALYGKGYIKSLNLNHPERTKWHELEDILKNITDPCYPCTKYPVTFIPHYIDSRMEVQGSRFLVWGMDKSSFEELAAPHGSMFSANPGAFFCKIRIDGNSKGNLLRELRFLGFHEKRLFPGLDGIGRYISDYYANN